MDRLEKIRPENVEYRERVVENGIEVPSVVENALGGLRQIEDPAKRLGAALLLKDALSSEIEAISSSSSTQ